MRRLADLLHFVWPERPAKVEDDPGQSLLASLEHEHASEQWVQRSRRGSDSLRVTPQRQTAGGVMSTFATPARRVAAWLAPAWTCKARQQSSAQALRLPVVNQG